MSAHFDPAAARSAADPRSGVARTLRQAQGERALQRDRERTRVGEGVPPGASEGAAPSTIADLVRDGPPPPVGEDLSVPAPLLSPAASASFAPLRETAAQASPPAQPLCAFAPPREPNQPRPDLFTPERRARFLAALAETGAVRSACARVGVSPECVYRLRRREALFAAAWDGALVLARRVAEDVLATRALDGVEEPVFYRGEQIGSRLRFDARLLLAHLARLDAHAATSAHGARRAERFDELLALVAGAEPPPRLAAPETGSVALRKGADPVLPPECAAHVQAAAGRLPPSASVTRQRRCMAEAAEEWQGWTRTARGLVDRLLAGADTVPRRTLSTVSTAALGAGLALAGGGGLASSRA